MPACSGLADADRVRFSDEIDADQIAALPADLQANDVVSAMRVGPADALERAWQRDGYAVERVQGGNGGQVETSGHSVDTTPEAPADRNARGRPRMPSPSNNFPRPVPHALSTMSCEENRAAIMS